MRKLLRSVVAKTSPVVAAALLAACQQQDTASSNHAQVQQAQVGDLAAICGFECKTIEAQGDVAGSASISGIKSIDAFFSATLSLQSQTALLRAEVLGVLNEMTAILGVEAGATIDEAAANVSGGLDFNGAIDGGLTLDYQPAQCSVSAKASVEAAAKCDVMASAGSVEVECKGECVAEASAMLDCGASAELQCKGTAPAFACEGECKGSCELSAGAVCEGTCQGSCVVDGSVACDGSCVLDGTVACDGTCLGTEQGGMCEGECQLNAGAMCTGECKVRAGAKCEGECQGSCELSAGATCEGECKGECTYTPPSGSCEAGAQASCQGSANASVQCSGECKGEVEPPEVKAECEATAKAEASFSAECTPPQIGISYNLSAEVAADVDASAEISAKVEAFGKAYGKLLAQGARIQGILTASAALPEAGANAVTGAVNDLRGNADLNAQILFQAGCALGEVPKAAGIITASLTDLEASASGIATVSTAL
ncbi:MAG TPA: hypothetical protein VHO25_07775 [Polyangiaceae bacterium]|nr:hypothetical protein [Polyangiaceae bacterium]